MRNEPTEGWFRRWCDIESVHHAAYWADAIRESSFADRMLTQHLHATIRSITCAVEDSIQVLDSRVRGTSGWSSRAARRCVRRVCDALSCACIRVAAQTSAVVGKDEEATYKTMRIASLKAIRPFLSANPAEFGPDVSTPSSPSLSSSSPASHSPAALPAAAVVAAVVSVHSVPAVAPPHTSLCELLQGRSCSGSIATSAAVVGNSVGSVCGGMASCVAVKGHSHSHPSAPLLSASLSSAAVVAAVVSVPSVPAVAPPHTSLCELLQDQSCSDSIAVATAAGVSAAVCGASGVRLDDGRTDDISIGVGDDLGGGSAVGSVAVGGGCYGPVSGGMVRHSDDGSAVGAVVKRHDPGGSLCRAAQQVSAAGVGDVRAVRRVCRSYGCSPFFVESHGAVGSAANLSVGDFAEGNLTAILSAVASQRRNALQINHAAQQPIGSLRHA